jgi:hypothetical protein
VSASRAEHLRGALLLAVVLVHGVAASPLPRQVLRSQYETPLAREEVTRWRKTLLGAGVSLTETQLVDASFAVGSSLAGVRRALLGPFGELFRLTGTGQGWGLFTYPDTFPHQLHVWTREGAEAPWEVRYAGLDPEHAWDRDVLAFRRVRGIYDGQTTRPGTSWQRFAAWEARRALEAFPSATHARVGFLRRHTYAPGEAPATPEAPVLRHAKIFAREDLP